VSLHLETFVDHGRESIGTGERVTDQPVFVLGEELQALEAAAFGTEAEFQELLAR
jgi:hypothetical protein